MRVVQACPAERLSYRLPGLPLSFAEISQQIYTDGLRFVAVAIGTTVGDHGLISDGADVQKPRLVQKCTESHEVIVKGFRSLTTDELTRDVDFNSERFPAVLMADWYVVNMVHHRGMMCTYLKSLRVDVPTIYVS
jgi:hypothetical protein